MTDLVNPNEIEAIVGINRGSFWHYGRAVSKDSTFYILHSQRCVDSGIDLRQCDYSVSLDRHGIVEDLWDEFKDSPEKLAFVNGYLVSTSFIKAQVKPEYRKAIKRIMDL